MSFVCGGSATPDDALRVLAGLVSCCYGAAEDGPTACTCWEPEFELDQEPIDTTLVPATRSAMCADCAYRPDSPERSGDDRYMCASEDGLPDVPVASTFWCHQGMRKPLRWRHPLGIVVECTGDFYKPPIAEIDGQAVPFKADGTPGDRCAGWAAHRRLDGAVVAELAKGAAS